MCGVTLALPISNKPYSVPVVLEHLSRLSIPSDTHLVLLDLSKSPSITSMLRAFLANLSDSRLSSEAFASARLIDAFRAGKKRDMFIRRGEATVKRYRSMAETFNLLKCLRVRGTDLCVIEDDILVPENGLLDMLAYWNENPAVYMLAASQPDRADNGKILAWRQQEKALFGPQDANSEVVRSLRWISQQEEPEGGFSAVSATSTGFCLFRSAFLDRMDFTANEHEAQDICASREAWKQGGRVEIAWGVKVGHVGPDRTYYSLGGIRGSSSSVMDIEDRVKADVAIVVSTWTGYAKWLREAIKSIEDQRPVMPSEKVLVCDGIEPPDWLGSDWQVIRRSDGCAAPGRNAALAQIKAPWVIFLDGDDKLLPSYVYHFVRQKTPAQVGFVYPDMDLCNEDMSSKGKTWKMPEWDLADVSVRNVAGSPSVWRTLALQSIGGWPHHEVLEDWGAVMRLVQQGWKGKHLPHVLVQYRQHGTGKSANPARKETSWQVSRFSTVTLLCGDRVLLDGWANYLLEADLPPSIRLTILVDTEDADFIGEVHWWLKRFSRRFTAIAVFNRPTGLPAIEGKYAPHYRVTQLYARLLPQVAAETEFVWMLEDDIRPPKTALRTLHDDGFPHTEKMGVCAAVYPARGCPERITGTRSILRWRPDFWWSECQPGVHKIAMMPGGCALYRGSAFREALPVFWRWSGEAAQGWDMALCRNLSTAGWSVTYHGSVKCEHHVKDYTTGEIRCLRPPD